MFNNIKPKKKAILYIICSALSFTFMSIFVRLSGDVPVMQKSFFRNFVAFIVAYMVIRKEKTPVLPKKENIFPLVLRSSAGTIGILCNFYAVDHMVLSDATILNKLSPFFVIIFSIFILKERISIVQFIGVTAAFIGALFVVKPTSGLTEELLSSFIGVVGGIMAGFAYTMVRYCNQRGVKGSQIVLFFSGFSCLCVLPKLIFGYYHMSFSQIMFLVLAGVSAAMGQFSITAAYSNAPAKEVSIYDYSQLIFAAVLGFVIFDNVPDKFSIIGYIIIFASSFAMFIYNNRRY